MLYSVKAPWWLSKVFYRGLVWEMPAEAVPAVYLTFDDGPHAQATRFVLDTLDAYEAKASFFCIGKNVAANTGLYEEILQKGHTVGNHTHNHLNGWKTGAGNYIRNITEAAAIINSRLFRPPYGKITLSQSTMLRQANPAWKIYMWTVLSGDFDTGITGEKCLEQTMMHLRPGAIVVFHDSEKAWERMSYALPRILQYCRQQGWQLKALPQE